MLCSASLNIYLNKDVNYCDVYGCLVSGWVNEYVEGQDSLSLCEVQADPDALWHEPVPFTSNPVQMAFELPEVRMTSDGHDRWHDEKAARHPFDLCCTARVTSRQGDT